MKYRVQQMAGIKLSTTTVSDSVETYLLRFWFTELTTGNPCPKDKLPPECPHILGWIANNASTHHLKILFPLALLVSESLGVLLMYCIRCTNLSQLSLLVDCTLVVINLMSVQILGLDLLLAYIVFPLDFGTPHLFPDTVICIPCLQ